MIIWVPRRVSFIAENQVNGLVAPVASNGTVETMARTGPVGLACTDASARRPGPTCVQESAQMPRRLSGPLRRPVALAVAAACLVAGGVWFASGTASAGTLSGTLYRDPNSAVVKWVAANSDDSRTAAIRDKIASQPAARWFANVQPVDRPVRGLDLHRCRQRRRPGAGAVGLRDHQPGLRRGQRRWRAGPDPVPDTGSRPSRAALGNRLVIIILETDSIALTTCLNANDLAARNQAHQHRGADHQVAQRQRQGLPRRRALGLERGRGPGQPAAHGRGAVRRRLLHQRVELQLHRQRDQLRPVDPLGAAAAPASTASTRSSTPAATAAPPATGAPTTTPTGASGQYPTLNTGNANVDGFLWVKPPGEADGCAFQAGSFQAAAGVQPPAGCAEPAWHDHAAGHQPPRRATTTPPPTTPPVTTTPPHHDPAGDHHRRSRPPRRR